MSTIQAQPQKPMLDQAMLETILSCLKTTFTSSNASERKEAEKKLTAYEQNILQYTQIFLDCLMLDSLDMKIKMAVALQLHRTITKYLPKMQSNDKVQIIRLYVNSLLNALLPNKLLKNLCDCLNDLLEQSNEIPELIPQLILLLCNNTSSNYEGIITIFTSIIKSNCMTKSNDEQLLKHLIPKTTKMLEAIISDVNSNGDVTKLRAVNDIFLIYFLILFKFKGSKAAKEYLYTAMTEVIAFGVKIVFLPIATYVPKPPICWYGDKTIDLRINEMKVSIIKVITVYMNTIPSLIIDEQFIAFHTELMKQIMLVLEDIITNQYNQLMTSENKQGLLVAQMLAYLNKAFAKETLMRRFMPFIRNFIKNILMPLLLITPKEIINSKDKQEYQDYAVTLEDALFNHKSKNVRSMTLMLLKTIVGGSKEVEEFVGEYVLRVFNDIIAIGSLNAKEGTEEGSIIDQGDKLVTMQVSNEVKLDMCLTVCIALKCAIKSKALINTISTNLLAAFPMLFNSNAYHYIKHKLCILLKVYFTTFLEIDDANHTIAMACLKYIYETIFLQDIPLLAEEATQSLNKMLVIIRKRNEPFIPIITNLLNEILKIVPTTPITAVFDVLWEIRMTIGASPIDSMLFSALAKRVNVEAAHKNRLKFKIHKKAADTEDMDIQSSSKTNNSQEINTVFINKIFNSLRLLMEEEAFVVNNAPLIEQAMAPMIFYMKTPEKIDFDEDIITIFNNLIKYSKNVSAVSLQLLNELPAYAAKTKAMLLDLYEILHIYIIYGTKAIEANEQSFKAVIKILSISSGDSQSNESNFYVKTLIHLWFCMSSTIPSDMVKFFIEKSLLKISELYEHITLRKGKKSYDSYDYDYDDENISIDFMGSLMVIYGSFINYSVIAIEMLNRNNQLPYLLQWTTHALKFDVVPYANRMIILSLCNLINNDCFAKDSFEFITFAFRFLIKQQRNESCKLKAYAKKRLKFGFYEENDESDEEVEEAEEAEEAEEKSNEEEESSDEDSFGENDIENMVIRTISPMKTMDEFREYRTAVEVYEKTQPQMYMTWTNSLSDKDRRVLFTILKTVRIEVNEMKGKIETVPRKIIKVKRSGNAGMDSK